MRENMEMLHTPALQTDASQPIEQTPVEKPIIIFLFGLTGAGKSKMGETIRDMYGFYLHEGDDDYTPALRENIRTGRVSTLEERDEYNAAIIERVKMLQKDHPRMVVAQMFPLNKHRAWLRANFPGAIFVWVKTPIELIDERLETRRGHTVDKSYAQRIRSSFELPDFPHEEIENDGNVITYRERIEKFMDKILAN